MVQEYEERIRELERLTAHLKSGFPRTMGVDAWSSVTTGVPTSAWTSITFDTNLRDEANFHSLDSDLDTFRVPPGGDGWYVMTAWGSFPGNVGGTRRLMGISLVGVGMLGSTRFPFDAVAWTQMSVAAQYWLNAGDKLRVQVYQDSGVKLDLIVLFPQSPRFMMVRHA